jgi:hypothetical protein
MMELLQLDTFIIKTCPTTRHEGAWGERRYSSYSLSTSALDGGEWSASRSGHALAPGKGPPGTHWTGGRVDPRAGLDTNGRPAHSQTIRTELPCSQIFLYCG